MANIQKIRFLDVFSEDRNETLTLKVKLRIGEESFEIGESFRKGEKMAGIDFHILRYFDIAVESLDNDFYEVKGFFPATVK
jgi:hypothetical protein